MKANSSPFLSRRTSCTGVGMACLPRDSKYYHSPLTHHQWNVNMGGYGQVFANTSSDGTSRTCTVTVDKKDMAFTFSITSSCRRSYQVSAQGGIGMRAIHM